MSVALALALVLAAVFAWAGATKVTSPERWRKDLQAYRLGRALRGAGLLLVPWLELLVAVAAVAGHPRWGSGLAVGLLVAFSAAIVRARILVGSNQLACGCFGGHATRDYRLLLLRNALVAGPAVYVVAGGAPVAWRSAATLAPFLYGGLAAAAAVWVGWQISRHLRRRSASGSAPRADATTS
jgi:hypothetical protein